MGVDEVLNLNQAANQAFTAAGKVGKSAKAAFNKEMGDVFKKFIKTETPNVAKANKMFELLFQGQKAAYLPTKFAVGAGLGSGLMGLLGIGGRGE